MYEICLRQLTSTIRQCRAAGLCVTAALNITKTYVWVVGNALLVNLLRPSIHVITPRESAVMFVHTLLMLATYSAYQMHSYLRCKESCKAETLKKRLHALHAQMYSDTANLSHGDLYVAAWKQAEQLIDDESTTIYDATQMLRARELIQTDASALSDQCECPICLTTMVHDDPVYRIGTLPCGHTFHVQCFALSTDCSRCPCCRRATAP